MNGALDDGTVLHMLLSGLSGQPLAKLDPPKMRWHKLSNLSTCLKFMEKEEVKLVGIGPEGIEFSQFV